MRTGLPALRNNNGLSRAWTYYLTSRGAHVLMSVFLCNFIATYLIDIDSEVVATSGIRG